MLFNSPEFVFAFLPLTLAGFYLFGRLSRPLALGWLVAVSVVFYAWWNPINLLILGISLTINFLFAVQIRRLATVPERALLRRAMLIVGIVFNLAFLGYFKYSNFIQSSLNDAFGTGFVLEQLILPLGISFITFQKIAFLIDVHARRVESFTFREFLLFVLFFPQLIAGPIVHYREMMPQFAGNPVRFDATALATGLTLFCFGLFKKTVLADGIAVHVSPIYAQAAAGGDISFFSAWAAAVGFTLQIYFDFSGYSDMALGLARCVGIRLPLNFDSPLKASSIIDFWLRWHVTLTRFLTAYIYNPLTLALTRRRVARRLPLLGSSKAGFGTFLQLLAAPTLLTMLISGVWHGAGYLFVLWGLVHGIYLVINHAWRLSVRKRVKNTAAYGRVMQPIGFVLTFVSVAVAMVLFRSTTVAGAGEVLAGLVGLNGISLPRGLVEPLGLAGALPFVVLEDAGVTDFIVRNAWVATLFLIATLAPNSLQIMSRFEPALDAGQRAAHTQTTVRFAWQPNLAWALVVAVTASAAILRLSAESEFLYWQF
jgi:alginate O-acetyltransferase complex protein AlgI